MIEQNAYQLAFAGLNPEQKKAVTTIEGPVMVLAGPGSGKTQVLGTRIGFILENTDTQAQNILCLTFTDSGVVAMRERLIKFIGKEAFKINIHTFHSFCNRVIQENPQYFTQKYEVSVASDLQKIEILRQMIDLIEKDDVVKKLRGEIYSDVKKFAKLFSEMKRENISPEDIERNCSYFMKSLDGFSDMYYSRKSGDFVKGDKKIKEFENYEEKCTKLISAARQIHVYNELLSKAGLYDYDDMIGWVVKAFNDHPDLLLDYQEQYLYILVDEFQDTNGIQNKLLELLCSFWEEDPNVFVVGDDDQAIYRFQGANVDNLQHFYNKYYPQIICLSTNYRSRPEILHAATRLIQNNDFRMGKLIPSITKDLQPYKPQEKIPGPKVNVYSNLEQEDAAIMLWLEKLLSEGVKPNQIAVISRNHASLSNLVQVCQKKQIPVYVRTKINALHIPIVRNLLTILRYIECYIKDPFKATVYLSELIQYPSLGITSFDVLKLINHYNNLNRYGSEEQRMDLREIMASTFQLEKAGISNKVPILELAMNIERWIGKAQIETLQVLFETILVESNILQFMLDAKEQINLLESVHVIFNLIKDESAKNSNFQLKDAIDLIDKMEDYKVDLPYVRIVGNSDGVQLLTAHGTKGLEYAHVWIKGADSKNWESIKSSADSFFFSNFNPVVRGLVKEKLVEAKDLQNEIRKEDERRLFYVAITRAEDELIISYAPKNSDKKETPSQYLTEIFQESGFNLQEISKEDLEQHLIHILRPSELTKNDFENEYLDRLLERFSLSSTALNNYLSCPLKFYYSNIMRIPQARSSSMGFGNVAHKVLERLWRYKKDNGGWPNEGSLDILLEKYLVESMDEYHSHFNKTEFENYLEYGRQMLPSFVKIQLPQWLEIPDFKSEIKIDTMLNNISLTGKLDRIDVYSDHIHVTDYKTGKFSNNSKKLNKPSKEGDIGGDYWRQVVFYKILLDLDNRFGKTMTSGSMDFIDIPKSGKVDQTRFNISPEEIEIVKEQITDTYNKIMNHDFYKGCGKPDCHACTLVKNLKSLGSFRDAAEEEDSTFQNLNDDVSE